MIDAKAYFEDVLGKTQQTEKISHRVSARVASQNPWGSVGCLQKSVADRVRGAIQFGNRKIEETAGSPIGCTNAGLDNRERQDWETLSDKEGANHRGPRRSGQSQHKATSHPIGSLPDFPRDHLPAACQQPPLK